jgi:hypothetical protein
MATCQAVSAVSARQFYFCGAHVFRRRKSRITVNRPSVSFSLTVSPESGIYQSAGD